MNELLGWSFFGTMKHGKADFETLKPLADGHAHQIPAPGRRADLRPALLGVPVEHQPRGGPAESTSRSRIWSLQKASEHDVYGGPSQYYCPAAVYEWVEATDEPRFVINAQNCVHCKTCDIKDPNQNINWTTPEGGGGPNYVNM